MHKCKMVTVAATSAVLGLFMAGPATAGGLSRHADQTRAASVLEPPVITEVFRPVLPCDHNTTVGQEGCGEREVLAADRQLDADVKVIFHLLGDHAAAHDLVTAQTAWLAYRDEDCNSQSDVYQGGTEQPVAYVYCLAADDVSRRQDLKGFFGALTQGLAKAPEFP
jgi:uncharacterized protein YecT (DUF1311 family)